MNRILCSTGGVIGRPNGRDITLLAQCAERLRCDGFELMMYEDWYGNTEKVCAEVRRAGVSVPVFHVEKQVGEYISRNGDGDTEKAVELFRINCRVARELDSEKLVLHLWSGLDSDKDMPHNTEVLKTLLPVAKEYGLVLTVENVVCNHRDPVTNLRGLAQEVPGVLFTFDTKMSEFHGQTEDMYKPENECISSRIAHIHVNDYAGGYMDWPNLKTLHIGAGKVDFGKLFGFIKRIGYTGDLTVEATSFNSLGVIDFNSLNNDFRVIREYLS